MRGGVIITGRFKELVRKNNLVRLRLSAEAILGRKIIFHNYALVLTQALIDQMTVTFGSRNTNRIKGRAEVFLNRSQIQRSNTIKTTNTNGHKQ